MLEHHDDVRKAHDEDDLLFGTVESWIVYVRFTSSSFLRQLLSCINRI